MNLNAAQQKNKEYNLSQTEVGHPLKTLKGSTIKRSNYGVGKLIGGQLYFNEQYRYDVLDQALLDVVYDLESRIPFKFSVIRWDIKNDEIVLIECPDFDTAREPVVGRMFNQDYKESRFFKQIYHHRWLFVKNNYEGFDVAESWEWSKTWLSTLTEPADGSSKANWDKQLEKFHLV